MEDKQMVELAAKAAGISGGWGDKYLVGSDEVDCTDLWFEDTEECFVWDPRGDDGASLRLAVAIGACIQPKGFGVEVWLFEERISSGVVEYGNDPFAATRLAILKVAAERGKLM